MSILVLQDSVAIQTGYALVYRGQADVFNWWDENYHLDWDIRSGVPGHGVAAVIDGVNPDKLVFGFQGNAVLANADRSGIEPFGNANWKARVSDTLVTIGNDILARMDPDDVVWLHDYSVSPIPGGNPDLISWAAALNWCSQDYQVNTFPALFPNFHYVTFGAAKNWANPSMRHNDGVHLSNEGALYMADRVIAAMQAQPSPPPPPPPPPPPEDTPPPEADPDIGPIGPGNVGAGAYVRFSVPARYRREVSDGYDLVVRAEVLRRDTEDVVRVLDIISGGLQGASGDLIRQSARFTFIDPDDQLTVENVRDELNLNLREIRLLMGPRYRNGETDLLPLGIFKPTKLGRASREGGIEFTMECFDRSIRAQRPFGEPTVVQAGTALETAVRDMIWTKVPTLPTNLPVTGFTVPALSFSATANPWTEASRLARSSGYTLRIDRNGFLIMYPVVLQAQSVPEWTFVEGPLSTFWDPEITTESDRIPNHVTVRSASVGEPAVVGIAFDDDPSSPTYVGGTYGVVDVTIVDPAIQTEEQAQRAAAAILLEGIGPLESPSFTCLPNGAISLDATVRLEHSIGVNANVLIDGISNLPFTIDRPMEIDTRRSILTGADASVAV